MLGIECFRAGHAASHPQDDDRVGGRGDLFERLCAVDIGSAGRQRRKCGCGSGL